MKTKIFIFLGVLFCWLALRAQETFRTDRIIIRSTSPNIAALHTALGSRVTKTFKYVPNIYVVAISPLTTVPVAVAAYQNSGLVDFAEPDFFVQADVIPNDPAFTDGTLWNLHNIGQNGGLNDADIDAPEGWDVINTASNVIVAVIDFPAPVTRTRIWRRTSGQIRARLPATGWMMIATGISTIFMGLMR